jgi:hypothetical protein
MEGTGAGPDSELEFPAFPTPLSLQENENHFIPARESLTTP